MRFHILPFTLLLAAFSFTPVRAEIKTQTIDYQQGGVALEGYLAYDDSIAGKRPGILICHEWWGLTDYPRHRAEQLAKLGYIAFALDMYGKGVSTTDPQQAGQLTRPFEGDRDPVRQRALAGLDVLRSQPQCDPTRVAAIGYCFGGMVALELARAGTDLSAVVSFHGALATPHPDQDQPIKAKILICTGADDAFVPPQQVQGFADEMRKAGADYQIISYGGAHHAFTNPDADKFGLNNIAYNPAADRRSWAAMLALFDEVFNSAK
jgi:dienelactone hydrolase